MQCCGYAITIGTATGCASCKASTHHSLPHPSTIHPDPFALGLFLYLHQCLLPCCCISASWWSHHNACLSGLSTAVCEAASAWCQAERRPEEFGLAEVVQQYHSLVPLEDLQAAADHPSSAFGVCTMLLRAAAPQLQGQAVTLRRLDPWQASCCPSSSYVCRLVLARPVELWLPVFRF